ncbi:uncharacterized protein LOC130797981 isoform X2 [Amaranthus tricolor]|uniref:uncharacterized protein LOC130797981 isoform X2 n=1 Tax=Amaranthus tricolor TaxID=29722 RepID=UPI00258C4425|nr:uncharacterized protein LOC130797981 isoform X2 [Amaranthus tricolor]
MQCHSYFPVCHSHYDLNVDANGGAAPLYNGNSTFRSGHYNDYMGSSPLPRQLAYAYRESLRQTMLMHEDTFRDQVQELHRLYRKQKELMGEIKSKKLYVDPLLEVQSSNSSSAKIPAIFGQNVYSAPFINSHDFAESKCKKIRGKILDLELPAEVYADSDEDEFLHPSTPATQLSIKHPKAVVEINALPSTAIRSLNPVLQAELPNPCSFTGGHSNLADLNEPLAMAVPEDARVKPSMTASALSEKVKSDVGAASSDRKPSSVGQNPSVVQALPSLNSNLSSSICARISGRLKGGFSNKVNANRWCSPYLKVAKPLTSSCFESKLKESQVYMSDNAPDLNSIDLNSVEVPNSVVTEVEDLNKGKKYRMIDINLPCAPTADEEPLVQDVNSGQLDLNFCTNEDGLAPKLDIDFQAPISPEVEECPPPRGDSEENHPEEGKDPLVKLANIAAEAIVFISSQYASRPRSIDLQKCKASEGGDLEWFAGLVDSHSIDLDNDSETIKCKNTCKIDDFEAMTLELTETKEEEYWCKDNVHISNETCSILLPCQTRRGRTRRSKTKRKDFQREVLPSLVSLSRYEVTEDILMIEGLMEAAGNPWQPSRTRRTCRMGRKHRVAKQPTFVDEVPDLSELMSLVSWGKVNRRSRGRRSHASPMALLKWLEYGC